MSQTDTLSQFSIMADKPFKRPATVSRAQEFQQWILAEIAQLPPDSCLPPDRELGVQWDLSTITIQRVLAKLRDEGKVIRIPGKGTFTPNPEKSAAKRVMRVRTDTSWESSVEHLASSLIRMISEGVYRKGKALPPVKFIRNQFRVSSETVTSAYQTMESRGYVEKIGKSYWVGRMDQLLSEVTRHEVYLFRFGKGDFRKVFTTDPMAIAFQKMERELYHSGLSLIPESVARLDALVADWETTGRYPAALLFYGVDASNLPFFRDLFARHSILSRNQVRFVVHGQGNDLSELTPYAQVLSRGNVETERARVLAHHLQHKGVREATLCLEENDLLDTLRSECLTKVALALLQATPGFRLHIAVEAPTGSAKAGSFAGSVSPEYRKYLESKYPGTSLPEVDRATVYTTKLFDTCRATGSRLWIVSRDKTAADALKWAREHNLEVPQDLALIGLENDPEFYDLGISNCGPDWDSLGFALAHAVIGDVKQARSQNGFLKVRGQFVTKRTTLR